MPLVATHPKSASERLFRKEGRNFQNLKACKALEASGFPDPFSKHLDNIMEIK